MATGSTKRRVVVAVLGVLGFVALAAGAMYLAGVLYLLTQRADLSQARITSVIDYWRLDSGEPQQRERLGAAVLGSAGCVLLVLWCAWVAVLVPWRSLLFPPRFASGGEIRRAGLVKEPDGPNILAGMYKDDYVRLHGQQPVMLLAPSGRGTAMVIPTLLCWSGSVVVLDIGGHCFDATGGFRVSHQPVFAFSPFNAGEGSHCWNPLSTVRDVEEHRKADLLAMAEVIFPSAGQESSEAFYNERARELFVGLGLLLFESPELPRTIGEMLRQVWGLGPSVFTQLASLIRRRKAQGNPYSDDCIEMLRNVLSCQPNTTLTFITATFKRQLGVFGEPGVDAATSDDDFRLGDVRRCPMSIYVRIPVGQLGSAQPLLKLFFSQLVTLNTRLTPAQDPALKLPCLLVNNAFAAMGRVDAIASKAAVLGDYNLRLFTVVERFSELDAVYGWQVARRFTANHAAFIFSEPLGQHDSEEYSVMVGRRRRGSMLGRWWRSASRRVSGFFFEHGGRGVARALRNSRDFDDLDNDQVVLVTRNCRPVLARKISYHSDEALQSRLRPPSVVPGLDMQRHGFRVQRRVRYVARPVEEQNPPAEKTDSPLVSDLRGLEGRLEDSHAKSGSVAKGGASVEVEPERRKDRARALSQDVETARDGPTRASGIDDREKSWTR